MSKKLLFSPISFPFVARSISVTSLLLPVVMLLGFCMQAQVSSNYNNPATQALFTYANLTTGAPDNRVIIVNSSATIDDAIYTYALPFDFAFNGICYAAGTNINISTNGFITFGATAPAANLYTPISSNAGYQGAISAYGVDLNIIVNGVNNGMFRTVSGTSPNRIVKLEWRNFQRKAASGGGTMNFQIWLYENNSKIEIKYAGTAFSSVTTVGGEVGLRGASNADFNNLSYTSTTSNWPASPSAMAAGAANNDKVNTRSGVNVANGVSNQSFEWSRTATCSTPGGLTASAITSNSATISWTSPCPAPSNGFQYYFSSINTPPGAASGTTAFGVTSVGLTGLAAGTTYYVWVRSDCGGSQSAWSVSPMSFTTPCNIATPYYSQFFNGPPAVPAIPNCTSIQNVGAGNNWVTANANATSIGYGFSTTHLEYNQSGTNDANVWYFTQALNLTGGQTYKLSYNYGGESFPSTLVNRMEVRYGNAASAAGMTNALADHPNIKTSPINNVINFTPASSGTYYIGFRAYSIKNNGTIFLDDIEVDISNCTKPLAVTLVTTQRNSQSISWTAPATPPASGYSYYVSTSPTTPSSTITPSGSVAAGLTFVNLTGLTAGTQYYFWVRGNCGAGEVSDWSTVVTFTTLPPITYCTPAPTSVDNLGIINVTFGTINNSTGAEPGRYGDYSSLVTSLAQGATVPMSLTYSVSPGFLGGGYYTRIWIDFNDNGSFADAGETVFDNGGLELPNGLNNISFTIPGAAPLGQHRLRIGGADSNTLATFTAGNGPCYTGSYGTFEDYSILVTTPPPLLTLSQNSSSQCAGTNSVLVTLNQDNYNLYSWSPSVGVTGNKTSGWTFNVAATTTFVLTGTQTSPPYTTNTVSFTYVANQVPTPITITPSNPVSCQAGPPTLITATGGIVSGIPVLTEDFNGTAPGWTTANNGTGGSNGAVYADWTLRANGYSPASAPVSTSWSSSSVIRSNDNTQVYFTNTDAQGSSGLNDVRLISPVFSLSGYTSASLSLWYFFRQNDSTLGRFYVEVSTDGGTTWPAGNIVSQITTTTGTISNFSNLIVSLNAFAGQSNLRLRIRVTDRYGWGAAVDNLSITATSSTNIIWSGASLFTDAAGTIPYDGVTPRNTIYAWPNASGTITASSSTPSPNVCTVSASVNITYATIAAGTASGDQSLACGTSTLVSNITLTGYVPAVPGTITGWQVDDNPSFLTPTILPGSAGKDTLTPADVTGLAGTTYFRAVITGCTTLYSNTVTVTYSNNVSWNGSSWVPAPPGVNDAVTITSGTYTLTSDLTVCSLRVSSGAVMNVNPGVTLTVTGAVVISTFGAGGRLNFLDDNTFTGGLGAGTLMQDSASTTNNNSGVANYQRWTQTRKFDYTYWSSPLNPMTLINVSPTTLSDKFLRFDSNSYQWTYPNPALTTMTPGVGYAIRGPQAYSTTALTNYLATFTGTPNNGNYTVALFRPSAVNDLNFIGNPYPSAISADALMDGNVGPLGAAGVGTTFYFWTHNTLYTGGSYVFSDYAAYNRTGGVGTAPGTPTAGGNNQTPNGIISAGQGFMVKAVAAGNITFTNAMRVAGNMGGNNAQFFRPANTGKSRVWLNMTNTNAGAEFKQLLVGYIPNATNSYEDGFDGECIDAGNTIGFYSMASNNDKKLMIQGRALPFDDNDRVALGYKVGTASTYEVALADRDGLFTDATVGIYLEDLLLHVIHDLRQAPYQFVSEPGVFNDRFVLRYNDTMLGVGSNDLSPETVVVYKQQDDIHVGSAPVTMKEVKIYDIQGRLVMVKDNINSQSVVLHGVGLAHQVLMVQVLTTEGKMVSKKIIF